jgi:nucleotide-binding universal stress UspA family protein
MNEGKFTKILVLVDGSKYSITALEHASLLAREYNSELIALYVLSSKIKYDELFLNEKKMETIPSLDKFIELSYIESHNWLNELKEKIHGKLTTDVIIAKQSVVTEIIEYSENNKIDLIVMGTRGRSGLKKLLLGSTAQKIITYAHCPVLVVR